MFFYDIHTRASNDSLCSVFALARQVSTIKGAITGVMTAPDPERYRRDIYWGIMPWELSYVTFSEASFVYPDNDLLESLVSLYFEKTNSLIPVLHHPTFMKSLAVGQHHWDPSFGMTVLLVCALGSKYSPDPRVLLHSDSSGLSSGWQYFSQVPVHRKLILSKTSVYDLQYFCLAAQYLFTSSLLQSSWNVLGMGLRYALELGAHRRKGFNEPPSVENELRKRAFWAIVCLERTASSLLGRPCAYPHETFDVDYPIECDDEYWVAEDPEKAFEQPAGKPCSITAFVYLIKLCEVLGFTLRTLYSNKKSRILSGFIGGEWEGRMVAALNSSMKEWRDSLPDYLHWDPQRQDSLFFNQLVNLHATYHYVDMQIHRQSLSKNSSLAASTSLERCTNAAMLCARILETGTTRGLCILPNTLVAAFTAGSILVLAILKREPGWIGGPGQEEKDFERCVNVLKECGRKWNLAGRFFDVLTEIGSMNEYPPMSSRKRPRQVSEADRQAHPRLRSSMRSISAHVASNTNASDLAALLVMPNNWDLQNLLLAEMGHPPGSTGESTENNFGMNAADYALPSISLLQTSNTAHTSNPSSGSDLYAAWSDILSSSTA
ncbi:hypothetical protein CVT25_003738 [Psilocybe cyanescens]|uniref:Xylanolytic transcriptional activator regulatory domain-containing protein n=1 Tax=Psilocybe cyanescens TaxID=93625 RepID=A0A409XW67_PSICY|nr:hypothetical protein CVT25_003738 [Psilocybe cyanescens]